jgi:pyrroline-5-carboxylate reductase
MSTIGFIGTGHYTSALAEGMFGNNHDATTSLPDITVILHDIDRKRAATLVSKLRQPCQLAECSHDVFARSDVTFLGVPTDQVANVLSELEVARNIDNPDAGVLLMDGVRIEDVRATQPDMPVGMIMYNYPVIYRCGIAAFWSGTLGSNAVKLTENCLHLVGDTWNVANPDMLTVIRATAGCGFGILAQITSDMEGAMRSTGLSEVMSRQALSSFVKGLALHLEGGGTPHDAALLSASTKSNVMRQLFASPAYTQTQRNLKDIFSAAVAQYRGHK